MKQLDLPDRIIRKYVHFLHKSLPPNPTAVQAPYDVPAEYAHDVLTSDYSPVSLQRVADDIGYYLGIPDGITVRVLNPDATTTTWSCTESGQADFSQPDSPVDYSGLYQARGPGHSEIIVVRKRLYSLQHVFAILAHEYAHHYLHRYGITLNHKMRDEYLTDIATAYLGLGYYVLRGYRPITWGTDYWQEGNAHGYTQHSTSVGYLTPDTIGLAILFSAPLRRWNPRDVVRRYPTWAYRIEAYFRLLPYRLKYHNSGARI